MGEVARRSDFSQDVTMEYYDTESRLRAFRRQEERLLVLLGRASTIDEILRVEGELNRVRSEMEMMQGRLQDLDAMVSLSSIRVSLEEVPKGQVESPEPGLWGRMRQAFLNTLYGLGRLVERGAVLAAAAGPYLLMAAALWLGLQGWRRGRRVQKGG